MHLMATASDTINENEALLKATYLKHKEGFIQALDDDFNTADGIAAIFELVRDIYKDTDENTSKDFLWFALDLLKELTGVLGLLTKEDDKLSSDLQDLMDQRQDARKNKDFKKSDELRDLLLEKGIVVEDTPTGVKWSYKR